MAEKKYPYFDDLVLDLANGKCSMYELLREVYDLGYDDGDAGVVRQ